MRLSSKKTVYLIDGMNFVWAMSETFPRADVPAACREFLLWLNGISRLPKMRQNDFRTIMDGGFRDFGVKLLSNVHIVFTEGITADEWIYERSVFLKSQNKRVAVVSNDRRLVEELGNENVRCLSAAKFFRMCEAARKDNIS